MKTRFLLPHRFKYLGWGLFSLGITLVVLSVIPSLTESEWAKKFNFFGDNHCFKSLTLVHGVKKGTWESGGDSGVLFTDEDLMGEIIMSLVTIGFVLIAFTKERYEDEWIAKIRLESLMIGFYLFLLSIFVVIWVTYGLTFWEVLNYCLLIPLIAFLVRFYWFVHLKPRFDEKRERGEAI
jgi:heme/copper-type cytochrome/quinol oxidase subunit 4